MKKKNKKNKKERIRAWKNTMAAIAMQANLYFFLKMNMCRVYTIFGPEFVCLQVGCLFFKVTSSPGQGRTTLCPRIDICYSK